MTNQTKILIQRPEDHEVETGDIYELHFSLVSIPFLDKLQRVMLIKKVNDQSNYQVIDNRSEDGTLIIRVSIVQNPFPLVLVIGGIISVLGGMFVWASLDRVYKIIETPAGKILSTGVIIGAIALVVGSIAALRLR